MNLPHGRLFQFGGNTYTTREQKIVQTIRLCEVIKGRKTIGSFRGMEKTQSLTGWPRKAFWEATWMSSLVDVWVQRALDGRENRPEGFVARCFLENWRNRLETQRACEQMVRGDWSGSRAPWPPSRYDGADKLPFCLWEFLSSRIHKDEKSQWGPSEYRSAYSYPECIGPEVFQISNFVWTLEDFRQIIRILVKLKCKYKHHLYFICATSTEHEHQFI